MDDDLLLVEQVLLLENLTYLADKDKVMFDLATIQAEYPNHVFTVKEIISKIEIDQLDKNVDYTTLQNGEEWQNVLNAVLADETLLDMKMIAVKEGSEKTGGTAAVFFNEKTGEVVVAFRGTEKYEWKDNFVGGALTAVKTAAETLEQTEASRLGQEKGTAFISKWKFRDIYVDLDTYYQKEALKWYQGLDIPKLTNNEAKTITVTGHSKGGNKAKYITIKDDTVTRCLSFDGQGFSDEFFKENERRIAERANVITNHNVNFDFVNLLLNDVGVRIYYIGSGYGDGISKIAEAHCPDTYFFYDEQGRAYMVVAEEQAEFMMELDKFLNSYLRILPDKKKVETLELIGEIAQAYLGAESGEKHESWIEIIDRMDGWDEVESLLTYLAQYIVLRPELLSSIDGLLENFWPDAEWQTIYKKVKPVLTERIPQVIPQAEAVSNALAVLRGLVPESWGTDLQPSICRPLERNRVFSISEMLEFGDRAKSLMEVGSQACMVWDEQMTRLEHLLDMLPAEVDASELKSILAQRGGPFYSDEYERMGIRMYNTANRIAEDMQHYDAEAARRINEIAENLDAITFNVKTLQEKIWEPT